MSPGRAAPVSAPIKQSPMVMRSGGFSAAYSVSRHRAGGALTRLATGPSGSTLAERAEERLTRRMDDTLARLNDLSRQSRGRDFLQLPSV